MLIIKAIINWVFMILTRMLCRIDAYELAKMPAKGPLIVVANHVNFLEVPVMFSHVMPRRVSGYAKAEHFDRWATRMLFTIWEGVPLRRGEADVSALRGALQKLEEGLIFAIAPEGTRTGDGRLIRGHSGIVVLALRSGAPIQPLVYWGHENYRQDWMRLRRAPFNIRIGRIFTLDPGDERVDGEIRQKMTDEIMYQIAALLPEQYRGVYADLDRATTNYIRFVDSTDDPPVSAETTD
jgi:1-acyl-sn-glycerol-3-phosphate acyltransferase